MSATAYEKSQSVQSLFEQSYSFTCYLVQIQIKSEIMEPEPKKILKILAMSDTHDLHDHIDISLLPEADIFIHAGDFTQYSYRGEMDRFRAFLQRLPYKHKIVIAGNHDFVLDIQNYQLKHKPKRHKYQKMNPNEEVQKLKKVCTYLNHQSVVIQGVKIFGSPYQPLFFNWGFQYHSSKAKQIWSVIPSDTDLLITHGPPFGVLDQYQAGKHSGCPTLLELVNEIKPKIHIFGHVHASYGSLQRNGTRFYNVANVNEAYQWVNSPTCIKYQ